MIKEGLSEMVAEAVHSALIPGYRHNIAAKKSPKLSSIINYCVSNKHRTQSLYVEKSGERCLPAGASFGADPFLKPL